MGLLERQLDVDLIERMEAGWTPSQRRKPYKLESRRDRPSVTYRGHRRNSWRLSSWRQSREGRGTWGLSWHVPVHRANYVQGWPGLKRAPGKYPISMRWMRDAWLELKKQAKAKQKEMLKMLSVGSR